MIEIFCFEQQLRDERDRMDAVERARVRHEEEVAQQRLQLKEETEATLHQKEEDNHGRMMMVIGGVGGAFVVMFCITFFLCNASKKKRIKKMIRKMNAEFDAEIMMEKERSEVTLNPRRSIDVPI